MIALDWSMAVSSAIFILTWFALSRLLLRPLLRVLEERQARTTGVFEDADSFEERVNSLIATYERRIKEEKQAGFKLAEQVRNEALSVRQDKISEARSQAHGLLEEAKSQVRAELAEARQELQHEAEEMARIISDRVLRVSG